MAVKFPAGLRVLVVDDDHVCLMTLVKMLHTCLYTVTECNRAETALSLLRENKNGYDVVISDVHMPDMDGLKLLQHIQLEMDLPVIMMSVDDETSVVMKAVTNGACDYLFKPVGIDVLRNIWQHVVRKDVNQLGIDKAVPKPEVYSQGQIMDSISKKDLNQVVYNQGQILDSISKKDLNQVMIFCARAVADNDLLMAQWMMDELRQMVSVSGEPIQRLGAYMLEGLVARQASSGSSLCKASRCKEPASSELPSYMDILYEVCPYFKFGYMSANGAIAEAMKDENRVHIIDFQIGQGSQWLTLIPAFAARPGGPPHIRITGIDDSMPAYAQGGLLNIVGKRLSKIANMFKVPFEFHAPANVREVENLGIRPGEALAMNFAFVLHHMPDESVSIENHRDRLLRLVKSLSPKVVTLVEQESNTNTAALFPRFVETLNYYTAMFESIDVTLPRDHKERINVEQHCLAKEVVNIIACEGDERVERYELLGKWRSRFAMAGFTPYPLSSLVNATIKTLFKNYSDKYRLEERDGALYLGWKNRDLVASCAWTFKPDTKLRFAEGQQHHSNGKPMNLLHVIPTTMEAKQLANLHQSAQSLGAMNMQINPHGVLQNSSPYMIGQPQLRRQIMNESIEEYPSYDTFNELPQQKSNDWNFFFY